MNFVLDPAITTRYPSLLIGVLVCRGIDNSTRADEIQMMLRKEEAVVRSQFKDTQAIKHHPTIQAWQAVHRSFGSNPNAFPSSIHALCKRVVKGSELPRINMLVDLYNVISLRYILPIGGEDIDRCQGNITLTFAQGTEAFTLLGGAENAPPEAGEIIYRDDAGVLCRKCNWREAARTCLTTQTTNAVLVIEAIPPVKREGLLEALQALHALVQAYCGGKSSVTILDAREPVMDLGHLPT